jgi:hypothetical protein
MLITMFFLALMTVKLILFFLQKLLKIFKGHSNLSNDFGKLIKSNKKNYPLILYSDKTLEEVQSYKCLGINFNFHLN